MEEGRKERRRKGGKEGTVIYWYVDECYVVIY